MRNQKKFEYIEVFDPTKEKIVERVYIGDRKESTQDFFYKSAKNDPLNNGMKVFRRICASPQKTFSREIRVAKGMALANGDIIACMKKGSFYVDHNGTIYKAMYPSGLKTWCAKGSEMTSLLTNELRFHALVEGTSTNTFLKASKEEWPKVRQAHWDNLLKEIKEKPVSVPEAQNVH